MRKRSPEKVPAAISVPRSLQPYWQAFHGLQSHRQSGMGANPISAEAVEIYARAYGLELCRLLDVVRVLDCVFLEHISEQKDKDLAASRSKR